MNPGEPLRPAGRGCGGGGGHEVACPHVHLKPEQTCAHWALGDP